MVHIVITQIWAWFYNWWIRYVRYHTCCTAASEFITLWFRRVQSDFPEKSYKVITAYHTITFLIKSSKLCLQLYRQQKLYIYQVWVFLRNLLQPKLQHKQLSSINTSTDSHNCDNPFQQFDFFLSDDFRYDFRNEKFVPVSVAMCKDGSLCCTYFAGRAGILGRWSSWVWAACRAQHWETLPNEN